MINKRNFRRIISSAVLVCLLLGLSCTAFAADNDEYNYYNDYTFIPGDANVDSKVNIDDATLIQVYLNGGCEFEKRAEIAADFNGDGDINIDDVTEIQKMMAELSYSAVAVPDYSYRGITVNYVKELSFDNPINTKFIFDDKNIGLIEYTPLESGYHLIRSIDEYYALFGCCRSLIDKDFFEDNALIVRVVNGSPIFDSGNITEASVDGNVLNIKMSLGPDYIDFETMIEFDWYQVFRVDKNAVADVNSISIVREYNYY